MRWVVLLSAFVILWFLALQVALPFGIKSSEESTRAIVNGTDAGAPGRTHLRTKIAIATLAAAAIWAVFYGLVLARVVDL